MRQIYKPNSWSQSTAAKCHVKHSVRGTKQLLWYSDPNATLIDWGKVLHLTRHKILEKL